MPTDQLIIDSVHAALILSEEEVKVLTTALERLHRSSFGFGIFGRTVRLVHPEPRKSAKRITTYSFTKANFHARLVFRDETGRLFQVSYKLRDTHDGRKVLIAEFPPATILGGNNIHPTTLPKRKGGGSISNPSSSIDYNLTVFRLGFDLLESLYKQIGGTQIFCESRSRIDSGDFRLYRVQWASYLKTSERRRVLQTATIVYRQTIAEGDGIIDLATHLGYQVEDVYRDEVGNRVKGLLLTKKRGQRNVLSVCFYDKVVRVAQMKQGKSLSDQERATIEAGVRLDITMHPDGVTGICKAAQRRLRKYQLGDWSWRSEFMAGEPEPTAWWLARAVLVLSTPVKKGVTVRKSFGPWLAKRILDDELGLKAIATFRTADFHKLDESDDELARAWTRISGVQDRSMAARLAEESGCSVAHIYAMRKRWLNELGIDLLIPYAFYRDLLFFGPNSVTSAEDRAELVRARLRKEDSTLGRINRRAAKDFDDRRGRYLKPALQGTLMTLPARLPAGAMSMGSMEAGEEGVSRSSKPIPLFKAAKLASKRLDPPAEYDLYAL